jgi:phosphoribosyl-ATP pyrophosphohydrolase
MGERTANVQAGDFGETIVALAKTIHDRRTASLDASYTARLLSQAEDRLLMKVVEEATELVLAVKENDHDHIRYEAGDLLYHLLVLFERTGITLEELAGELNARMI